LGAPQKQDALKAQGLSVDAIPLSGIPEL